VLDNAVLLTLKVWRKVSQAARESINAWKHFTLMNGGTNFILRIKEQETRLILQEHDDDDECNIYACS
jgi:hypothetical protein